MKLEVNVFLRQSVYSTKIDILILIHQSRKHAVIYYPIRNLSLRFFSLDWYEKLKSCRPSTKLTSGKKFVLIAE